jgi:hypothetical protein
VIPSSFRICQVLAANPQLDGDRTREKLASHWRDMRIGIGNPQHAKTWRPSLGWFSEKRFLSLIELPTSDRSLREANLFEEASGTSQSPGSKARSEERTCRSCWSLRQV